MNARPILTAQAADAHDGSHVGIPALARALLAAALGAVLSTACVSVAARQPGAQSPMTLGELVRLLAGVSEPSWAVAANDPRIEWKTDGVRSVNCEPGPQSCSWREGITRVKLRNGELKRLGRRLEIVRWSVELESDQLPHFPPERVEINPISNQCGPDCTFDVRQELGSAGIAVRQVCKGAFILGFETTVAGRKIFLREVVSAGSRMGSTSLTMYYDRPSDLCAPI